MAVERVKESKAQTLAGTAIVLVIVAILFVVIGVLTRTFELAVFGGGILGLAIILGLVGMGMSAFRR